jgi:predicted SAM-dependent methyltransferase
MNAITKLRRLAKLAIPPAAVALYKRGRRRKSRAEAARRLTGMTMLHFGCGDHILAGWANIDLDGSADVIPLDLSEPLPLADATVRYIFSEHFIEHIPQPVAEALLRECRRVLEPDGVLRISTPDLRRLVREYFDGNTREFVDVGWEPETPAQMMNQGLRLWGHQFVYDAPELEALLRRCGFSAVTSVEWRESTHDALRGLEVRPYHGELIVEATR